MSNSKQDELMALSNERMNKAYEQIAKMGLNAGLDSKSRLVLLMTARTAGALIAVSGMVQAAGGKYAQDVIDRLDQLTVSLSILGSTAIAKDEDIIKDADGEADRLASLVADSIKVVMDTTTQLSQEIKANDGLLEAAKAINEARRREDGSTLQ